MKFAAWLKKLNNKHREYARQVYIEKHGHTPEEFEEGAPVCKGGWPETMTDSTLEELKCLYPEPIVTGPPSNKPLIITIDLRPVIEMLWSE